jgi:ribosomal protein L37AE/L43A
MSVRPKGNHMALSGRAKTDYQRMYMQLKRNGEAKPAKPVTCSFCGEASSSDRLLVGDQTCAICEHCITLAVARIAEARRQ